MHHPNFKDTIAASPYIFTIGVAGDSGSGKTTFTQGIRNIFGSDLVSTITLDDYHSLDREGRKAAGVTALNPKANRLDQLERDLIQMKRGVPIEKPVYNHATGKFDPPVIFRPQKILILEGLHTFSTPTLRKYLDFTLFVNPEREVKYDWKIRRDVAMRGYAREDVLAEIREREPDYVQYIAPADALCRCGHRDRLFRIRQKTLGRSANVYRISLAQNETAAESLRTSISRSTSIPSSPYPSGTSRSSS